MTGLKGAPPPGEGLTGGGGVLDEDGEAAVGLLPLAAWVPDEAGVEMEGPMEKVMGRRAMLAPRAAWEAASAARTWDSAGPAAGLFAEDWWPGSDDGDGEGAGVGPTLFAPTCGAPRATRMTACSM